MDWVTGLPPGGGRGYNACLVIFDRFSKPPISLPCHTDDTAMDPSLLIWNRVVSWTGIFTNIISDIYISIMDKSSPTIWDKIILLYSLPPTN
ncbi:hypothetical protein O181_065145 [Austropuccinia psidii MF-1]|uniref:Uncharacterized protein n=1 Tax=Austropuccinia psidii MF-1 TaxID=1389203 RepID=A0A9Q3I3T7_9BASI|nr:hypothetical protein [Austropuccinia psidii MF-1]